MEMPHHRLVEKLEQQAQKDAKVQQTSGAFNEMSMMHQYMGLDGSKILLMSDGSQGEPVMTRLAESAPLVCQSGNTMGSRKGKPAFLIMFQSPGLYVTI